MLEAEQVAQFVSQHRQQIHSPGRCAKVAGLVRVQSEFTIGIGSGIDEPAEAQVVANDGQYPLLGTTLLAGRKLFIDYEQSTLTLNYSSRGEE